MFKLLVILLIIKHHYNFQDFLLNKYFLDEDRLNILMFKTVCLFGIYYSNSYKFFKNLLLLDILSAWLSNFVPCNNLQGFLRMAIFYMHQNIIKITDPD